MWQGDAEPKASSSSASARQETSKNASATNLARSSSSTSLFKRAISLQFLVKNTENIVDNEQAAFIKMRYKDVSKHVIWPVCRLPDKLERPKPVPLVPTVPHDPRAVLMEPDMEDHKSPYMPCTINHVLRSDSEDSSEAEQVLEMTRLSDSKTPTPEKTSP